MHLSPLYRRKDIWHCYPQQALWTVLERIGCPPKFISMIRLFHEGMTGQVLSIKRECDGSLRNQQRGEEGLRSSIGPLQYLLHLHVVPHCPSPGERCLHSLSFGRLFLRSASSRCQSKEPAESPPRRRLCRRLCTGGPHRIRPAADAGPLLKRFQALRPDSQSRQDEGAPPTCTKHPPPAPNTVIDNTPHGNVDHFIHLGSTISCDDSLDKEIVTRISNASQALGKLRNRVLNQHNIRLLTELKSTMLWFSPPSFTVVKRGYCVVDTSGS